MKKFSLNGIWKLSGGGYNASGKIPGSVYSVLLENGLMEDPHYRDNELKAQALMDNEFTFSREFELEEVGEKMLLHFDGIDTLCNIRLNGEQVAFVDNMHRTWEFDVTNTLKKGINRIELTFPPVDEYLKKRQEEHPVIGPGECTLGFPHLRKAHCMMGWDWGPRLPDAGIFRSVYLLYKNSARIEELRILQRHEAGRVFVTPILKTDEACETKITITAPSGEVSVLQSGIENEVKNPELWWPNGLGAQPLYKITAEIIENGEVVDKTEKRIGLRELKLIREKDKWGESFLHEVNGVRFFAMGADYIPEDNILSRVTPERTRKLLAGCKDSHFNAIRVWGGGYYPDDFFFDACDEMGIVVFLDMMFACCVVDLNEEMEKNIRAELYDNLKRIRHHASIAVLSGNNEIEEGMAHWWIYDYSTPEHKEMYLKLYEEIMPEIIKEVCPELPFVPSSPSTCGRFVDPRNEDFGDCHYWLVWGGGLPFKDYRNHFFRYLSEFGFQGFPDEKTINAVTEPRDRNIFSRVMEMHQRNGAANGKILSYIAQTYLYPTSFSSLIYASQVLQAEAIKYGVEHFRRNRGRCMGTLYWQVNDIWPVASWASIDYYGRYKALQYFAKRFYSPVIISAEEIGEKTTREDINAERIYDYETKARLVVTNDTLEAVDAKVNWELRNKKGDILTRGEEKISVDALSVYSFEQMDFHKTDVENNYLSFSVSDESGVLSEGTVLFTAPKHFDFIDPELSYEINGDEITVKAGAYAKSVEIYSPDSDFILSDNFFDMNGGEKTVKILEGEPKTILLRSVYDIR